MTTCTHGGGLIQQQLCDGSNRSADARRGGVCDSSVAGRSTSDSLFDHYLRFMYYLCAIFSLFDHYLQFMYYLCAIFSLFIHYLLTYTIYSLFVYYLFTIFSLFIYYLITYAIYSLFAYYLFTICVLLVLN